MLSRINISNLDNSVTESEVSKYTEALQNSTELDNYHKKLDELKQKEIKSNNNQNNSLSNIKKNNNNNEVNCYQNDMSSNLSKTEEYESCEENDNSHIEIEKELNDKSIINNLSLNKENNDNDNSTLQYKNDKVQYIYEKNKNETIDLKSKNSINKIINNNNINNLKLSNINIIINKGDNYYSQFNNDKNNLSSAKEKNKRYNLEDNSISSDINIKKEIKSEIKSKFDDKENEINDNNEEINKNLNIQELTNINNKNVDQSKEELNDISMKKTKEKKSYNLSSSNLGINSFKEFDNVTIITKIKKKDKKNTNSNSITKSFNSYNENTSFLSLANTLLVNSIKFDGIGNNEIDLDFLKSLRTIPIKYKNKNKKRYLKTLLELQHFYIDDSEIRVIKISEDGQFLSAGMRSGMIKLFDIIGYDYNKFELTYDKQNALNYLNFINEKKIKILKGHTKDVMDLSWSSFFHNLLLSCSLDNLVILWDTNLSEQNCKIQSFDHKAFVTCISFSPTDKYIFATGSFDKFVRIWDIKDILEKAYNNNIDNDNNDNIDSDENRKKKIEIKTNTNTNTKDINKLIKYIKVYFNIQEKITALSFFPTGEKIAIGTHNGKIIIYEVRTDNFFYKGSFNCRNRIGKNSLGKKITSIEFFNKNDAIISSCDSRIRLMSMNDEKLIHKYKGHLNENSMIRSSIDYNYDIIISGSENGFCYVWNIDSEEKKNLDCECFKPYSQELIHCSLIVPEKCYCNFLKKIMKITDKLLVTSIIINATNKGRLEVLLNIDEK